LSATSDRTVSAVMAVSASAATSDARHRGS
jgi:hypothetical protein